MFETEDYPEIWFYTDSNPRDLRMSAPHVLAVFGRPEEKLLFGYVEFFGGVRLISVLNSNYTGPREYLTHTVDPIRGSIEKCDIEIGLNREQILAILAERNMNAAELSKQLGTVEQSIRTNQHYNSMIDNALRSTMFKPENMGKDLTPEMWDEFMVKMTELIMPDIARASEKRRKEAEDKKEIEASKLKKEDN